MKTIIISYDLKDRKSEDYDAIKEDIERFGMIILSQYSCKIIQTDRKLAEIAKALDLHIKSKEDIIVVAPIVEKEALSNVKLVRKT